MLISGINKSMRKIKSVEMKKFALKSTHVSCIYHLYGNEPLTAGELCDICREDKASISRAIEQLEEEGCVVSAENGGKKYRTPFVLTLKGREIGRHIVDKVNELTALVGEGIEEHERSILYKNLETIYENLMKICDGYGIEYCADEEG